jgi:hypothetical protein
MAKRLKVVRFAFPFKSGPNRIVDVLPRRPIFADNYQHDPLVFARLCLSEELGEVIKVFDRLYCRPQLVADYLREDRHLQLSSYQVSAIISHDRAPRVRAETEELRVFVAAIGG